MQYRSGTGKAGQFLENGMVLGIMDDSEYAALEISLAPGDRQVLYRDRILEAANSPEQMYGAERFMRFLESNKSLNAGQFTDALLAEIARWTGQSSEQGQQDDLTLVLFDFKRS